MNRDLNLDKDNISHYDIYLGFGSNIGIPEENLLKAIRLIRKDISGISVVKTSGIYISSPVGNENQPYFLNCIVLFKMTKAEKNTREIYKDFAKELLFKLKNIEKNMGRKKEIVRYLPRVIDIDILLLYDYYYRKVVKLNLPEIKIPHPEIRNRKFVLLPFLDLCSDAESIKSIKRSLKKIDRINTGFHQKVAFYGRFNDDQTKILR